jgi:eukaryotic-like serine/threonine-protein kinase
MDAVPGAGGLGVLAGRYEVGALVGFGGTARVYRARDQVEDATVAVKIFPTGSAAGPGHDDLHRDGSRELAALGGMRHPGLVGVRDSGVDDEGRPFVVMDFVDGQSLAARLRAARCRLQP